MMISLLVAASENNVIGKDGNLPWHLPADLKNFRNLTWGMPIIMGRKTFESIGKSLPGRINIVITAQPGWQAENVLVASDIDAAIDAARASNCKEAFIIGGGNVYGQTISKADSIYITRVHATVEGDTFFLNMDSRDWEVVSSVDCEPDEKNKYAYSFQHWKRK